ncbi:MAG: metallophosphoesterase family protein, partial [Ferruginibacter sp.]
MDETVFEHFKDCDEVWHIGDFGTIEIAQRLIEGFINFKPATGQPRSTPTTCRLRGVYGNIDGQDIRDNYPEQLVFFIEEVKVMLRHIGGYPPKYNPATMKELL